MRGMRFSEFAVDQAFTSRGRTVTEASVMAFADISGDSNPLHVDAAFAETTPFGQRIAHGMLGASISTGLAQSLGIFEGTTLALLEQTFQYIAPIFFGDTIRLTLTVTHTRRSSKGGRGVVTFRSDILNQKDEVVTTGHWNVLLRD
jgi:acyl dehydratase